MYYSLNEWLEQLGRAPIRPEALAAYREDFRLRRDAALSQWFGGAFLILVGVVVAFCLGQGGHFPTPLELAYRGLTSLLILVASLTAWTFRYVKTVQKIGKLNEQSVETRRSVEQLLALGSPRRWVRKLGHENVLILNEAARRLLFCRELLAQPVWSAPGLAPSRRRIAEDASAAAEGAMYRVIRLVLAQGDVREAHSVIGQLQELSDRLGRLTARQEETAARSGDGQSSLRATLIALQELEAAEAEVHRQSVGL